MSRTSKLRTTPALIAVALALSAAAAAATDSQLSLLAAHDTTRAHLERLPALQLKQLYLACSSAAAERALSGGEVSFCSVAYDVLLRSHFRGDFFALLTWSRSTPSGSGSRSESAVPMAPDAAVPPAD